MLSLYTAHNDNMPLNKLLQAFKMNEQINYEMQ